MNTFLSLALFVVSASAFTIDLKNKGDIEIIDCGSKVDISRIEFDQSDAFPCIVHHGTTATGRAHMTANAATDSLTCKIVGIIPPGIELPFNGCHVNACDNLSTVDCPVEVGERLVYDINLPISNLYPTIEITGKWKLMDENNEMFLCVEVPMKISS